MPTNLTDTSSFDTATSPVGSDIRNAASVRASLQPLANRTRFLFDQTAALADIAALKAIASPADGLVRLVKSKGLYVFDLASVSAEALPFIVQPTVGSGCWVHELYLLQGQNSGLAPLDSGGKVPAAHIPNRIVSVLSAHLATNFSVPSSGTWTDALTFAITGCVAGDILHIHGFASVGTGGVGCRVRLALDDGGIQTPGREALVPIGVTDGAVSLPFVRRWRPLER